jgi:NAD-dependent SIR2 family protein deacetylase
MLSRHAVNWKADVFACFEEQFLYFLEPMLQSMLQPSSVTYVISKKYCSRGQLLQICNRNIDTTNKALFCLSRGYVWAKAQL